MSDESPSAGRALLDLVAKLLPALVLAVGGWVLAIQVAVSLHDQRITSLEARQTAAETENRVRSDRMTSALDTLKEQNAEMRATVVGLAKQVEALTRAIERLQTRGR